jgi:hypothetical protein
MSERRELDDVNGDVLDVIDSVKDASRRIANAISADAAPGHDAAGGMVSSLTEALMGLTSAGMAIAEAINNVAEAMRESARRTR